MKQGTSNKMGVWIGASLLVLVTGGVIALGVIYSPSDNSGFQATMAPAISTTDWTDGNKSAKVSLVEYGDFQCPACGQYFPMVQQFLREYRDKVTFVFRNFPLYGVHQHAESSAEAAEAAGLQGKYWQMNELLYENQSEWSAASVDEVGQFYDKYASALGLDLGKFHADIKSDQVKNKIQSDAQGGNNAQVDHTPTFFINLKQIPNPNNYDELKSAIDKALQGS